MRLRLILLAAPLLLAAAPPTGDWLTQGKDGVIRITRCGDALCGRIVGMDAPTRPDGSAPTDPQDHPLCGLTILNARRGGPDHWSGTITDPDNGTTWQATLRPAGPDRLALRGYVLLPLLGRTQTWTRYAGPLGADCAMARPG